MSIEKKINELLEQSKKLQEEAISPEKGAPVDDVEKANDDQTVDGPEDCCDIDTASPVDQSKEISAKGGFTKRSDTKSGKSITDAKPVDQSKEISEGLSFRSSGKLPLNITDPKDKEQSRKKMRDTFGVEVTHHPDGTAEYTGHRDAVQSAVIHHFGDNPLRAVLKAPHVFEETDRIFEAADLVSSGRIQHMLDTPAEKKEHAAHIKKTYGLRTTFHGDDELEYHGAPKTVRDAVVDHYTSAHGDKKEGEKDAKALHSHLFERSSCNEMRIDMSQDVEALVHGENLSEEFKTKAATIFEAAVITRVKQEMSKLEEQFDARLQEEVETIKEGLVEKVDGYLNYVVESWIEDNEIALESGIKTEIVESFIHGMKGLFEQHYIDVPEEKYDVLGEMEQTVKSLEEKLNESVENAVELKKELNEMKRASIVNQFTSSMTDTESEKFKALVEELSFEDSRTFTTKLKTIRENYFGKKTTNVSSFVSDEPVMLSEDHEMSPAMKAYLKQLNSKNVI